MENSLLVKKKEKKLPKPLAGSVETCITLFKTGSIVNNSNLLGLKRRDFEIGTNLIFDKISSKTINLTFWNINTELSETWTVYSHGSYATIIK